MSNCTVNPVKAYLDYSLSLEAYWRAEWWVGWYPYNVVTREVCFVSPRSIRSQKRVADGFFVTRKVEEVPVRFGKARLTKSSNTRSAARAADVQFDAPVPLYPGNFSEGGDDGDGGHAGTIWYQQDLSDQSSGGTSAPEQIQPLCTKAGFNIPATVFESQKLIVQGLASTPEKLVLSAALAAGSDAFKLEKQSLHKRIGELKAEFSS